MSIGFLSVVQDSYDNVKVFVIASLKSSCVFVLGIIEAIYKKILIMVTLTATSPDVVYRISCFLLVVLISNSKANEFVIFLNELQDPKLYSRGK